MATFDEELAAAFLLINAAGLCSTYGHVVIA